VAVWAGGVPDVVGVRSRAARLCKCTSPNGRETYGVGRRRVFRRCATGSYADVTRYHFDGRGETCDRRLDRTYESATSAKLICAIRAGTARSLRSARCSRESGVSSLSEADFRARICGIRVARAIGTGCQRERTGVGGRAGAHWLDDFRTRICRMPTWTARSLLRRISGARSLYPVEIACTPICCEQVVARDLLDVQTPTRVLSMASMSSGFPRRK